jgi:hypothetical protein
MPKLDPEGHLALAVAGNCLAGVEDSEREQEQEQHHHDSEEDPSTSQRHHRILGPPTPESALSVALPGPLDLDGVENARRGR